MKLFTALIIATLCSISLSVNAQTINLKKTSASVAEVITAVEKQTGYTFLYQKSALNGTKPINIDVKEVSLQQFLNQAFGNQPFTWEIQGRTIVLEAKKTVKSQISNLVIKADSLRSVRIIGVVNDVNHKTIPNATISVKARKFATFSDKDGRFTAIVYPGELIEVSYMGFEKFEYRVVSSAQILVELVETANSLKEVVASGIINRRAESFTGAATTITREELLKAGNQNILQSLKNLDPSFKLIENLQTGSNPNNLPEIVLRGKSSMPDLTGTFSGNPNQPLFILDGFEVTLQRVYDLDMNRVKTITLLKDAVAKAIYGGKAGNGVVVIETIEPKSGKLQISYNANINIEAPDLTGYNLMDAKEKLQWEKDHGMWNSGQADISSFRQGIYNSLYQDVYEKGVNTDWLPQPLQTGVGQRHSLSLEGGDQAMRYGATFMYNNIAGAMKGSSRDTYTGSTTLSYRLNNVIFRNTIEFAKNRSINSPYGSFSQYVAMNPYWAPRDNAGNLNMVAGFYPGSTEPESWQYTYNPLYNASLNIIDRNKYLQVSDNFSVEWRISSNWRFNGSVGYLSQTNGSDYFLPPGHTNFINYNEENGLVNYKGNWTKADGTYNSLESNVGLNYTLNKGKHLIIANATLNLSDIGSRNNTVVAEGFGSDFVSDISMASFYQRAGTPGGSDLQTRSVGVVGILNYSYDNRFIFDATYRTNGSSLYGANAKWGNFWSLGAGWNLHNEAFIRDLGFSQLRLRATTGYTGTQNANAYNTKAVNNYINTIYDGVRGTTLVALPNPNLGWQRNIDYNAGIDVGIMQDKFSARVDFYKKTTSDLVTTAAGPPSFGFPDFTVNLGKTVNTGYEVSLRYQAFNNAEKKSFLNFSIGALHNKNRLTNIGDAFSNYNNKQDDNVNSQNVLYTKPVSRYFEGQSLSAIYAVRSLGIDPASGRELFLDKQGNIVDTWLATNQIIAGDTEPTLSGNFGINAGFKGFSMSVILNYRFGGQLYNSTLVERVENINGLTNLDRRVFDAWTKVGDVAIYRAPQVNSASVSLDYTKPTTRFVQDNNEVYVSTINLSYDVQSQKLLKKLGMNRLRATFYTNEFLRISSIETERGTNYPFARNFSFSLTAGF